MDLGRYFKVGRTGTPKGGIHLSWLPTWIKVAATLLMIVALVFVGITVLANQNQLNIRLEALRAVSRTEAFHLASRLTGEIAELEDFIESNNVQEVLLQSQGVASPASDEIVILAEPVAAEVLETLRQTRGQIESAALVSKSGVVLAISPASGTFPIDSRGEWTWFEQVMNTGSAYVSQTPQPALAAQTSDIQFAVPIKQTGASEEVLGVLYVVVDSTSFAFVAPADSNLHVMTYDRAGTLLIPSLDPIEDTIKDDAIPGIVLNQILANQSGTAYYESPLGQKYRRLYGYVTISELKLGETVVGQPGWVVVAQQLDDSVIGETQQSTNNLLRIVGTGAGIIGLSILLVAFLFSRPLLDLAHTADQIVEQDDLELPILAYSNGEVGVLAGALRRLADRLSSQNTQLNTAVEVTKESLFHDLDLVLNRIVQTMGERSGYRGVGIYVVEPNTQRARVRAAWGALSDGLTKAGDIVIVGPSTLVGRALMKTELQRDLGTDATEFAGTKARPDELVVPFLGRVSGALQVIGSRAHFFSEGDIDILRLIANQLGFMLENREILTETQIAKEEAEKANRVKSQFLANMSHELRTPLNAILNFTGFVMDGDTGQVTEEQIGLLSKVYQSGEHLLNLINDILDLSKIEADMMQFLVEEVDLNQMLVSTVSVAKGLIKEKDIELGVQIEEHLPIIRGDKRRLRQVFLNLVSNAVKFTREGSVTLEAFSEDGGVHISVSDTGVGIAPEDSSLVFEAFRQGKHDYEVSGTGLGLTISKHFVEAHGGKIWFESEVGAGTTFHVVLPISSMEKEEASTKTAG